ncbi:agmatine deiminase (plasmid) [Arthrobacter sp. ERGS1:01]|uniref:agmatine deiminase family protein n=1 Tax=Arthrobacter sp. ERGS1:01 TaxID=1704044 RepID=UPI0006B67FD4|nr:agmatine deiminase family protein [Arthrobacter sp. ERGS1:01]ALE04286.1 agmatine deiminase [Arthrobacter sp. ERGS1:01]
MPSECAPQERIWMAFPPLGETFGATDEDAAQARTAWVAVAHAVLEFEPVTMLADPRDAALARELLHADIDIVQAPLDDAWLRDAGPTFVLDEQGALGAVDWVFNGWGQQEWATWEKDAKLGKLVAELAGAQLIDSPMVNEGGGIQVDGEGTVLLTDTVQLDRFRNPGMSRNAIEAELERTLGATSAVWLPRGLYRDTQRFGTRGHVDIVATIPAPDTILLHRQHNPEHPDFFLYDVVRAAIEDSTAPDGQPWQVRDIPAPAVLKDNDGWVDYSYVNHLVVNGGVIACSFDDENDAVAAQILAEVYPGRKVVTVDAREIFAHGGGIHCITQHQPRSA